MNEETEQVLRSKNITPTAMRILVLECLQRQTAAISLQDLEQDLQHSDRVTLYRTLKTFEEKSLVHAIHDGTGSTRYALCADACKAGDHYDLHLHFYCYDCGQTFCLPKHAVPEVSTPPDYILKDLHLIAKGTCGNCRTKQCN
jgi:Fur family transcriptional regulator, ferric uptake regulator